MEQRIKELEQEVAELKSQNTMLRLMYDAVASSINAVGITDLQGKLIYVNEACVKTWGYDNEDEMLGRPLPEFWEGDGVFNTVKELQEKGVSSGEDTGKKRTVQCSMSNFQPVYLKMPPGFQRICSVHFSI